MKKRCILLVLALLLCMCPAAWAENGTPVEVIRMDGVSVVVLASEETMLLAGEVFLNAEGGAEKEAGFLLPRFLTVIEKGAFEGIAAAEIEVSINVTAIQSRAFADCRNLEKITIPPSVKQIDDDVFEGCENVTVYGTVGTEAERIAAHCGFTFIDPDAQAAPPPAQRIPDPPVLPPVSLD